MKKLVVTCSRGLECLLSRELHQMGYTQQQIVRRGVLLTFSQHTPQKQIVRAIYRTNYLSRIGTRVLWPLAEFKCKDAQDVYHTVKKIDWARYIPNTKTFRVDSVAERNDEFKNTLFVSQKTKDAIVDRIAEERDKRPNVEIDSPDVVVNVHIAEGVATVSLDTSGEPLFHRGYRLESGEAPLHETLAAAILFLANYNTDIISSQHTANETTAVDARSPPQKTPTSKTNNIIMCDPFCGSGTFLAEAAMMRTNTPAGYQRHKWSFFHLPEFSSAEWESVRKTENSRITPLPENVLFGADRSADMISVASHNLKSLGFTTKQIVLSRASISEYCPPLPPTLIVTNPPYGLRLGALVVVKNVIVSFADSRHRLTIRSVKTSGAKTT
jgi:putative N6-adenine-specific DNA methylase